MNAKKHKGQRSRWKLAFIGSLVMPGLGQLYAGSLAWALGWVLILCAIDWGTAWAWVTPSVSAFAAKITALSCLGLWAFNVLHAAWLGRRGRRLALPQWLRVTCYAGFIAAVGTVGMAEWYWVRSHLIDTFELPSEAMVPNLLPGDRITVNRSVYQSRGPLRGEVVVFDIARDKDGLFYPVDVRPYAPRTTLICRIVGVPGDQIAVRRGVVYLNQQPVNTPSTGETYTDSSDRQLNIHHQAINSKIVSLVIDPEIDHRGLSPKVLELSHETPAQAIPPGRYFLLGDNRSYAVDSRYWGTIRRENLIGPAMRIYYPSKAHGGESWLNRVGQVIVD